MGGKSFSHAEGGGGGSITSFSHIGGGEGAKSFHSLKGGCEKFYTVLRRGAKSFRPTIRPAINDQSLTHLITQNLKSIEISLFYTAISYDASRVNMEVIHRSMLQTRSR